MSSNLTSPTIFSVSAYFKPHRFMQLGFCTDPATLATLPQQTKDCDFIEGHVVNFLTPEAPDTDFAPRAALMRQARLPMPAANVLLPPTLKVTGPQIDQARLERYARTAFRRAREIGVRFMVFGSAGARMIPDGFSATRAFEQYVEVLRAFGALAAAQDIVLLVEPLNRGECNLVNTLAEGAEAVRRADMPAVKLLVDIFHMLRNGESPEEILKVGGLVRHVHVAENIDRAAPGVHGDDFRPFLRALREIGYHDRLTIEAIWADLPGQLAPALARLRAQLADAGY